jgi:hypothetical protein
MITSDSHIRGHGMPLKVDRSPMFLTIAMATNGVALFNQPSTIDPTRNALLFVGVCLLGYLTPFVASLFLLLRHRTLSELTVAYFSLVCSIIWLVLGADVIGLRP